MDAPAGVAVYALFQALSAAYILTPRDELVPVTDRLVSLELQQEARDADYAFELPSNDGVI
ncbi:MAG: hypothetical protein ACI9KE_002446 [Polyangiales bacterium]|jgi:hypothetical protein